MTGAQSKHLMNQARHGIIINNVNITNTLSAEPYIIISGLSLISLSTTGGRKISFCNMVDYYVIICPFCGCPHLSRRRRGLVSFQPIMAHKGNSRPRDCIASCVEDKTTSLLTVCPYILQQPSLLSSRLTVRLPHGRSAE